MMRCFHDLALASRSTDDVPVRGCSCRGKHSRFGHPEPDLQGSVISPESIGYTREQWLELTLTPTYGNPNPI